MPPAGMGEGSAFSGEGSASALLPIRERGSIMSDDAKSYGWNCGRGSLNNPGRDETSDCISHRIFML